MFYSLVVRDPKRGWVIASDSIEKQEILEQRKTVLKNAKYRAVAIETDGNSRHIAKALARVKEFNGKGFAPMVRFQFL